jgi:magnesium chelatase subunit ChlI-like protein
VTRILSVADALPPEMMMRAAMGQMNLSARGYHRVLKLARTIADLAGRENIHAAYLAEALRYSPKMGRNGKRRAISDLPKWRHEVLTNAGRLVLICRPCILSGSGVARHAHRLSSRGTRRANSIP